MYAKTNLDEIDPISIEDEGGRLLVVGAPNVKDDGTHEGDES